MSHDDVRDFRYFQRHPRRQKGSKRHFFLLFHFWSFLGRVLKMTETPHQKSRRFRLHKNSVKQTEEKKKKKGKERCVAVRAFNNK